MTQSSVLAIVFPIQRRAIMRPSRLLRCVSRFLIGWMLMHGLVGHAQVTAVPADGQPRTTRSDSGLGSINAVAVQAELKTVKLYGAGGIAGLDAYQSGFFISAEGHILTVWTNVLDVENIIAVTSDGSRYLANVVGIDPNLEIAVLETQEAPAAHFDLATAVRAQVGDRCLAVSNLFGIAAGEERSSVQRGIIMADTDLRARRGFIESVYSGRVYIIDAMTNNPGAAGGALVNMRGQLLALLGKELLDSSTATWINYAVPIEALKESVDSILAGDSIIRKANDRSMAQRPVQLESLGIVLIPNVLAKTPAYVDRVQRNSAAEQAGLASDDLILFVNSTRVTSQNTFTDALQYIDRTEDVVLMIQRSGELKELVLSAR